MMLHNRSAATPTTTSFNATDKGLLASYSNDDDDVDHPNVKYVKRRSVKQSPPHMIGLFLLFTLVLSLWHQFSGLKSHSHRHSSLRSPSTRVDDISGSDGQQRVLRSKSAADEFHQQQKQRQRRRLLEERFQTERLQRRSEHSASSAFSKYDSDKKSHTKNNQKAQPDEKSKQKKKRILQTILTDWLQQFDSDILNNVDGGIRWIRPYLLPPLFKKAQKAQQQQEEDDDKNLSSSEEEEEEEGSRRHPFDRKQFFSVKQEEEQGTQKQGRRKMQWESEWNALLASGKPIRGPAVDYTDRSKYRYPQLLPDGPPSSHIYPPLQPLRDLLANWDNDDDFPGIFQESLLHFNYSNPKEVILAKKFRDAELPFKLYNVPEIDAATQKWTDVEYLNAGFKEQETHQQEHRGHAQESPNNFFAFYVEKKWSLTQLGLAPVRDNLDWDYATFAAHARYADATRLSPHRPHFYWQSGTPAEQRWVQNNNNKAHAPAESFISRDLPSFLSSPTENTFFVFDAQQNKGIQCRFGERGVTAATHYDSGMNFVAMITGAKRYILQPPRECSKLGLVTDSASPLYRHSLLNFAHLKYLKNNPNNQNSNDYDSNAGGMSDEERAWLEKASKAQSVETVLKQGEALYIPSHWFHYIVSLQKSAQCNSRSGKNEEGHPFFGNAQTVHECRDY